MKKKMLFLLTILALALWVVPASATLTTTDLFFTVPNTGGLDQYTLGPGQFFAQLHITVDTGLGSTAIANFDLTPGHGFLGADPVDFVLLGTGPDSHVLGLSVNPTSGAGPFDLTLTNVARTPFDANTPTLTTFQGNPGEQFDGFGKFNTGINSDTNGFNGAMTEVTFDSIQQFANANAVLAALTANSEGFIAAVDIGAVFTDTQENTGVTGTAAVPIPPSALLLGSGLLGLGVLRFRRA